MVSQHIQGVRQEVAAGTAGNIVNDQGLGSYIRNGGIVGDETFLGGLVVVGRHCQQTVGAVVAGALGEVDDMLGVVGAYAGHHGDTAIHPTDGEADHFLAFFGGEGGTLAGGAYGNQGVDTVF